MTSFRRLSIPMPAIGRLIALVLALTLPAAAAGAQTPAASAQAPEPQAPEQPAAPGQPATPEQPAAPDTGAADDPTPDRTFRRSQPAVRIGQDFVVRPGDVVREVVVISGSATIDGEVDNDVVVVLGSATLGPNAEIGGNLVVVAGGVTIAPGARVDRDFVVVGGETDIPAGFSPGGEHVVVGAGPLGVDFSAVVPWITRGLLWGRPLVPDLAWTWWLVGIFLFVYLAISLLLTPPVQAALTVLTRKPLTAFLTGLLVLLLIGPVSVILAVSVIGLPVVPLLFFALLVAAVLGKVSVMHWIGDRAVVPEEDNRWHWTRSFLIGFAVVTVAYMVPVVGFTAWALLGVLGLGAASLAFIAAFRRESPPRQPPGPIVPPVPPVPPSPVPGVPASGAVAGPPFDQSPPIGAPGDDRSFSGDQYAAVPPPPPPPPPPAVAAPGVDLRTLPYAGFLERVAAFALDLILVIIVFRVLGIRGPDDEGRFFLLLLAYHVGFWAWKQTTVGGIICNLRLVRTDGGRVSIADALVRGLSSILSLVVVGLGVLWILKDPERQSWHDKIAGTYVVKVPKQFPVT